MKCFMLLLALGLVSTDKLDRTYLPPPGSKYSGGSPGDLDVPLEFPKESYTTTAPFRPGQGASSPGDTRLTVGTDRVGSRIPVQSKDLDLVTPATTSLTYYSKVPTTTTSYAFTQTTTFPPEGFETTISPITGFPVEGPISEFPGLNYPSNQGQIFNQQNLSGLKSGIPPTRSQTKTDGKFEYDQNLNQYQQNFPSSTASPGRPGYTQNENQYQQTFPSSTVSPASQGNRPGQVNPQIQSNTLHLGVQPPGQLRQQFPSTTSASTYQTVLPSSLPTATSQGYVYQPGVSTQYNTPQGYSTQSTFVPQYPLGGPSQYNNDGNVNIPGSFPDTNVPQQGQQFTAQQLGQQPIQIVRQPGQQDLQTTGPQTMRYIDQYGNVQTVPSGTNFPQQNLGQVQQSFGQRVPSITGSQGVNQQIPTQPGLQQFGGDLNSVPGTSSPTLFTQQQASQNPQLIGQQGIIPSTISPQGAIIPAQNGFNYQQSTVSPQGSSFTVPSTVSPQGTIVSGQQRFVPSTTSPQSTFYPGMIQGVQNPQLIGQQVYPTRLPQGTMTPGTNVLLQNPPGTISTGFPQQVEHQPQLFGQSSSFPSPVPTPGYSSNYQPGFTSAEPSNRPDRPMGTFSGPNKQFSTPRPGDTLNIYQPASALPSSFPIGYNQSVSSTTSSFPSYGPTPTDFTPTTTRYPFVSNQEGIQGGVPINEQPRPQRPQAESDRNAVILYYDNNLEKFPNEFAFSFDTSNGIHADENGTATNGVKADGSYSYIGDDGRFYKVVYSADENGFQPQGDHLPTPPPVPEAIQRVIDQADRDKEAGISHDGFYDETKYGHKKYQRPKHRRPQSKEQITINGANIPEIYKNEYERISGKKKLEGGRKPITSISDEKYEDQKKQADFEDSQRNEDTNDAIHQSVSPTRRPSYSSPEKIDYEQERKDKYDDEVSSDRGSRPVSKDRFIPGQIDSIRRPLTKSKDNRYLPKDRYEVGRDEEDSLQQNDRFRNRPGQAFEKEIRKPLKTGETQYTEPKSVLENVKQTSYKRPQDIKRPGAGTRYDYDENYKTDQSYDQDGRPLRPIKGPSRKVGTKLMISDDSTEDYYEGSSDTPTKEDKYEDDRRPEFSDTRYRLPSKQRNEVPKGRRPSVNFQGEQKTSDDVNVKQSNRPALAQKSKETGNKNYQQIDAESGYRYTPPQNKFDQVKDRYPNRFQEVKNKPTSNRSSQYDNIVKQTTVKPFMTPNVYSEENESYEESSEQNLPRDYYETTPRDYYDTTDNGEYYDQETESDLDIGDDDITANVKLPNKVSQINSSSRRPLYRTKTTGRPQNRDYEQDRTIQKDTLQLLKKGEKPTDFRKTKQDFSETSKTSNYNGITSTTPLPFRGSSRGTKRPQSNKQGAYMYSNTDESSDTTGQDYFEGTRPGFTTSSRKPIFGSNSFHDTSTIAQPGYRITSPRPSSRPGYEYSVETMPGSTFRPETSSSTFGSSFVQPGDTSTTSLSKITRPQSVTPESTLSTRPTSAPVEGYFTQNQPGSAYTQGPSVPGRPYYPGSTVSSFPTSGPERTSVFPEQNSRIPGKTGVQNVPSTTYRPNYSGTVDAFGRQTNQPGTPGVTKEPGFSTSSQESGLTSTLRPNQVKTKVDALKPSEARIGQPNLSFVPGQKPVEFGPSSMKTPVYLSPSRGEDFSGPKQPQRFDSETGYHY